MSLQTIQAAQIRAGAARITAGALQAGRKEERPHAGAGYPFGEQYPFGISISGADVTVHKQLVYRGGIAKEIPETTVTLATDGDWVVLKLVPGGTTATDVWSIERWPDADGLPQDKANEAIYRGLHQFDFAYGKAAWRAAGWMPGDLGMMGY